MSKNRFQYGDSGGLFIIAAIIIITERQAYVGNPVGRFQLSSKDARGEIAWKCPPYWAVINEATARA